MNKIECFPTSIYFFNLIDWVDVLNKKCDFYINKSKEKKQKGLGVNYYSEPGELIIDDDFQEFNKFICDKSLHILDEQGYNVNLYNLKIKQLWVQEFSILGGGNHSPHIHSNSHISGFYFLKCSNKTSYPIFHDSRLQKRMSQLTEKNINEVTNASDKVNFKPIPGTFIFFNSYLEHEFVTDLGIDPFRFVHFNIQAIRK
jgi:uncharacterized protein (TIGR02466 family)